MKYGICNEMFENWSFEQVCEEAARLGYHGVEIAPFTLAASVDEVSTKRRRELRQAAEQRGLEIIGLHWLLVGPPGLHITHPDPDVRNYTAGYFRKLVHLCGEIGGRVLVIGSPKQRNILPGVTYERAFDYARAVFESALEIAVQYRVTLAIEPLTPDDTNFITTAAEGIRLIEAINHPLFRLHLDVKAMCSESTPIPDIIRSSTPHLAHFHANDPNKLGPGMGNVDHEPIVAALKDIGYNGYLSVEVFDFTPGPQEIARQSIEYLKRVTEGRS